MPVTVGQSIKQATHFLKRIHDDASTLITSLDELLNTRGWKPTQKKKISEDLGNSLWSTLWVMDNL